MAEERSKGCRRCGSNNQKEFSAEVAAHFRRLKDVGKAPVLVFTQLLVCIDCCLTEFTFPEAELKVLVSAGLPK